MGGRRFGRKVGRLTRSNYATLLLPGLPCCVVGGWMCLDACGLVCFCQSVLAHCALHVGGAGWGAALVGSSVSLSVLLSILLSLARACVCVYVSGVCVCRTHYVSRALPPLSSLHDDVFEWQTPHRPHPYLKRVLLPPPIICL